MGRLLIEADTILGTGLSHATALAVEDGRVAGAGVPSDFTTWVDSETKRLRLGSSVVSPGFVESHAHLLWMGQTAHQVDCSTPPNRSVADILTRIRARAALEPPGTWIVGFHYDEGLLTERRPPTLEELSAAAPNHPVYLSHNSGHLAVTNRYALRVSGVDRHTAVPGVVKDAHGAPTGLLREAAALTLVGRHLPTTSLADKVRYIGEASQMALQAGVTAMTDAAMGLERDGSGEEEWRAYQAAAREGILQVRTQCYARWYSPDAFVPPPTHTPLLQAGGVKLFMDGSIQGHTGALSEPYYDDPEERGMLLYGLEELTQVMALHHGEGRQIIIHCNGDAAVDRALQAFRRVLPTLPHPYRHRIEHAQAATAGQLQEMAHLGVLPSFFVNHVYYYGDRHRDWYLGPARGARISPLAEALRYGLRFSLHSDAPVTALNPLATMRTAVERRTREGQVLGPEMRIDSRTALLAYTRWAAYLGLRESLVGSLEAGTLADFTVLDGNPLDWSPDGENPDIQVSSCWIGGTERYQRR